MTEIINHPLPLLTGLIIGLIVALAVYLNKIIKCHGMKQIIKKLEQDKISLQECAANQAAIMVKEINGLKEQVNNQKITINTLRGQPDKKDLQALRHYNEVYQLMLKRAPGFAQAWQDCLEEVRRLDEESSFGYKFIAKPLQWVGALFSSNKNKEPLPTESSPALPEKAPSEQQ